jgi:phage-related minor tail protein
MALKYPLSLVIQAVDRVTGPLEQINKRLERSAGKLTAPFRRLGDRVGALSQATGLPKVVDGLRNVGSAAGAFGARVLGITGALTAMGAAGGVALYSVVRSAQEAGNRLQNMSARTGLSVDAFAELEFAAKRAGVGNEAFAAGMERFNKSLSEARRGAGPLAGLLDKVGIRLRDQLKGAKSNKEAFELLTKAMGQIKNPGRRAEIAVAAFGKAGAGMVNALKDGPEGIAAVREEFRRLVGSQGEFAARSTELGDAFDNMELSVLGLRNAAAGALFPAITKLAQAVTAFVTKHRGSLREWAERTGAAIERWVDGGGMERLAAGAERLAGSVARLVDQLGGIEGVAKIAAVALGVLMAGSMVQLGGALIQATWALGAFAARLGAVQLGSWALGWVKYLWMMRASIMAGLIPSLTAAGGAIKAFGLSLLASPLLPVIAAVGLLAGAAYLIYRNWGPISGFFIDLWQTVKFHTVQAWESISGVVSDVWGGIVDSVMSAWEKIRPVIDAVRTGMRVLTSPAELVALGATEIQQRFFAEPQRALPAPGGGEARVTVDFANLPRGATVTPARGNSAPLDLNLGFAMPGVGQ